TWCGNRCFNQDISQWNLWVPSTHIHLIRHLLAAGCFCEQAKRSDDVLRGGFLVPRLRKVRNVKSLRNTFMRTCI
ncbi:unnamed protein product, partial [Amoebophrya sp. A25]